MSISEEVAKLEAKAEEIKQAYKDNKSNIRAKIMAAPLTSVWCALGIGVVLVLS